MELTLLYQLYHEDFWKIDQSDWENATLSDFDTLHFHGDLIFRCAQANFDYRNLPLLGFAYEFTEAFLRCAQGHETLVSYSFLEGSDWLLLRPTSTGSVQIESSYTHAVCEVAQGEMRIALRNANHALVKLLSNRFPFLLNHSIFLQIISVLNNV
ncbi:hypothetical protein GXSOP10_1073 [Armatimonadetes bacterium GXS]|jgi:hypothetical protein|nr:hypothetical protein GXSOP10_1073 [Armatimonadetes bacterium GXS]